MDKYELINSLKKVKIVIGNGFDLYCGLKTRYYDYFHNYDDNNNILIKWIQDFKPAKLKVYIGLKNNISNRNDFWIDFQGFDKANFWDLFFFMISKNDIPIEEWDWCDIETTMLEWLHSPNDNEYKDSKKGLEYVYRILCGCDGCSNLDDELFYLATFIFKKNGEKNFKDLNEFYNFLLLELNKFEKKFGKYFFNLQIDRIFGCVSRFANSFNVGFQRETLEKLGFGNSVFPIDTFNFSSIYVSDDLTSKLSINHINGDYENPIFGVDSNAFPPNDPRYIFTKTYRRMNLDSNRDDAYVRESFENIVIFGSSLGKADYSYFFSIFDKINIVDLSNDSKIVFAFSIYDKEKENKIKQDLLKAIFDLFNEYSIYKGNNTQPNRLLDALTTQGKVILYEI